MADSPLARVLFLCTGNSARSIMAEAILNGRSDGRFQAFSAGSEPRGEVQPLALEILTAQGLPVAGLRSKDVAELQGPGVPTMDVVIAVCDRAAQSCPTWPGAPVRAHWGIPDPGGAEADVQRRRLEFSRTYGLLSRRIDRLLALPWSALTPDQLQAHLEAIGSASVPEEDPL